MGIVDVVRRANRPGPAEHSLSLRIAAAGSVLVGIAACRAEGELSTSFTLLSILLVATGMAFSYATREPPLPMVKPVLAVAVVIAFTWFFIRISRGGGIADIGEVEGPLAVLFIWVQVTHAFDVPARRDLAFSLAGSASLMAVAAAQAIDLSFAWYVALWLAFGLWGLIATWGSASGGGQMRAGGRFAAVASTLLVAALILLLLPAPHVSGSISFPSSAAADSVLPQPSSLAGDGSNPAEPARPGSPTGRTRIGGYLGFANKLDTSLRPVLGNELVMRVRAQVPSYWIGETYDTWNGEAWSTAHRHFEDEGGGSPFTVPAPSGASQDLQTFYIAQPGPNMIFHAAEPTEIWFPAGHIYVSSDYSTAVSPLAMGAGTIYTVSSSLTQAPAAQLAADRAPPPSTVPGSQPRQYLQLPHPYPRAESLAEQVTSKSPTIYAKVEALIAWIGAHTHYSTNIPPLAPGADTVDDFLFGSRTGFCEQISTSLAVMLRSIGIPAREAVGYVPDQFDPITDLYEVRAKDAHAWVQVWFPGYGWQSFDPTAVVPAANPSPGSILLVDAGRDLAAIPVYSVFIPLGIVLVMGLSSVVLVRSRRRRPGSWAERVARNIEREGARSGRRRRPDETLAEYGAELDRRAGDASGTYRSLAWLVEMAAYGGVDLDEEQRTEATVLSRKKVTAVSGTAIKR
ncbi:MAG TPA: transglutaminaseTgpA domain-containing protein [Acidimicrobiales bacterium]|nr:transglutaminaseTgpA domain-containing protein [Acidimicrobiales bacterium]